MLDSTGRGVAGTRRGGGLAYGTPKMFPFVKKFTLLCKPVAVSVGVEAQLSS
jgi:hypothetical protein